MSQRERGGDGEEGARVPVPLHHGQIVCKRRLHIMKLFLPWDWFVYNPRFHLMMMMMTTQMMRFHQAKQKPRMMPTPSHSLHLHGNSWFCTVLTWPKLSAHQPRSEPSPASGSSPKIFLSSDGEHTTPRKLLVETSTQEIGPKIPLHRRT